MSVFSAVILNHPRLWWRAIILTPEARKLPRPGVGKWGCSTNLWALVPLLPIQPPWVLLPLLKRVTHGCTIYNSSSGVSHFCYTALLCCVLVIYEILKRIFFYFCANNYAFLIEVYYFLNVNRHVYKLVSLNRLQLLSRKSLGSFMLVRITNTSAVIYNLIIHQKSHVKKFDIWNQVNHSVTNSHSCWFTSIKPIKYTHAVLIWCVGWNKIINWNSWETFFTKFYKIRYLFTENKAQGLTKASWSSTMCSP